MTPKHSPAPHPPLSKGGRGGRVAHPRLCSVGFNPRASRHRLTRSLRRRRFWRSRLPHQSLLLPSLRSGRGVGGEGANDDGGQRCFHTPQESHRSTRQARSWTSENPRRAMRVAGSEREQKPDVAADNPSHRQPNRRSQKSSDGPDELDFERNVSVSPSSMLYPDPGAHAARLALRPVRSPLAFPPSTYSPQALHSAAHSHPRSSVWRGQSVNKSPTSQPTTRRTGNRTAGAINPAMAPTSWTLNEMCAARFPPSSHPGADAARLAPAHPFSSLLTPHHFPPPTLYSPQANPAAAQPRPEGAPPAPSARTRLPPGPHKSIPSARP